MEAAAAVVLVMGEGCRTTLRCCPYVLVRRIRADSGRTRSGRCGGRKGRMGGMGLVRAIGGKGNRSSKYHPPFTSIRLLFDLDSSLHLKLLKLPSLGAT